MQDLTRTLARVQRLRMYYNESNNDKKLGQKPPDRSEKNGKRTELLFLFIGVKCEINNFAKRAILLIFHPSL